MTIENDICTKCQYRPEIYAKFPNQWRPDKWPENCPQMWPKNQPESIELTPRILIFLFVFANYIANLAVDASAYFFIYLTNWGRYSIKCELEIL